MEFREELLHWIWQTHRFDFNNLETVGGRAITIHNSGTLNRSDGPDFKDAEITIGDLRWYGDVEIHWKLADWKAHGHHKDPNYEQVILHVLFEHSQDRIKRKDGSSIPNLCLGTVLDKPLKAFVSQYQKNPELPCSAQLSFISEDAFAKQLQLAHKEYFEKKVEKLLDFYDPSLVPSQAWVKMFVTALFDGLGIPHNRINMQQLARKLFMAAIENEQTAGLRELATKISGIHTEKEQTNWNHKGLRPANHPSNRIKQAADCFAFISEQPFKRWMQDDPEMLWKELILSVETTPAIGRERSSILFGTVFLPALYFLGNLFFHKDLKNRSWELWQYHKANIPRSLLKLFEETKLPSHIYKNKLGAIHQIRDYCKPKKCESCKVFKSAISS